MSKRLELQEPDFAPSSGVGNNIFVLLRAANPGQRCVLRIEGLHDVRIVPHSGFPVSDVINDCAPGSVVLMKDSIMYKALGLLCVEPRRWATYCANPEPILDVGQDEDARCLLRSIVLDEDKQTPSLVLSDRLLELGATEEIADFLRDRIKYLDTYKSPRKPARVSCDGPWKYKWSRCRRRWEIVALWLHLTHLFGNFMESPLEVERAERRAKRQRIKRRCGAIFIR